MILFSFIKKKNLFLCQYLPPATKLGQGNVFTSVCDSVHRGWCAWRGVCVAVGVGGHVWLGGHAWPGGMCGWGGHAWPGGRVWLGGVVHGGGHAWLGGMHGQGVCAPPPLYEIWPVNVRAICILLEYILVKKMLLHLQDNRCSVKILGHFLKLHFLIIPVNMNELIRPTETTFHFCDS